MAGLVTAADRRALVLFLLLVTKASASPWNAALGSSVWARSLGLDLPNSKTARSTISKVWLRLERHSLVRRERKQRLADVFLLREDGSGQDYSGPGSDRAPYFQVPLELWRAGPDERHRWYEVLTLPELAVLLIGRSLGDGFLLPQEKAEDWYGISADTVGRGLEGLRGRGLLSTTKQFKSAPLSPLGYTEENRHTLLPPFGPVGHVSGSGTAPKRVRKSARKGPEKAVAKKAAAKAAPMKKAAARKAGATATATT